MGRPAAEINALVIRRDAGTAGAPTTATTPTTQISELCERERFMKEPSLLGIFVAVMMLRPLFCPEGSW